MMIRMITAIIIVKNVVGELIIAVRGKFKQMHVYCASDHSIPNNKNTSNRVNKRSIRDLLINCVFIIRRRLRCVIIICVTVEERMHCPPGDRLYRE